MHRKIITLALICASIAAAAFAQELPMAKPESVGVSSERLERIGTAVQRSIDEKRIALRQGNDTDSIPIIANPQFTFL